MDKDNGRENKKGLRNFDLEISWKEHLGNRHKDCMSLLMFALGKCVLGM
jgi:hypothetical protein